MNSHAVAWLTPSSLEEVARIMLDHRIGCVPVVNDSSELCGIVTESDFTGKERGLPFSPFFLYRHPQVLGHWLPREGIEKVYRAARSMTAGKIMTSDVITLTEDQTLEEAVKQMVNRDLHRLPVTRDNVPVGIVTRHDLLRLMVQDRCG